MAAEKDRQFVVVLSPAYVKPILDGSKSVIVVPGANQERLDKLQEALDDLRTQPDLSLMVITPSEAIKAESVDVSQVREVRSG